MNDGFIVPKKYRYERLGLDTLTDTERTKLIEYLGIRVISYIHANSFKKIDTMLDSIYPPSIDPKGNYDVVFRMTIPGDAILEAIGFARMLEANSGN